LRKRVGFAQFNLLDAMRAPLKRLDLIYCQNVLIYFARERRRDLLATLANLLKPGGLLVLGPGEVTQFAHAQLARVDNRNVLAYRRTR
jgi:chemotaxis methyl-accepting protein methylase